MEKLVLAAGNELVLRYGITGLMIVCLAIFIVWQTKSFWKQQENQQTRHAKERSDMLEKLETLENNHREEREKSDDKHILQQDKNLLEMRRIADSIINHSRRM